MKPEGISLLFLILLLSSCKTDEKVKAVDQGTERLELLSADSAFSALSVKDGRTAAFTFFLDKEGTLLRPDASLLSGANAIEHLLFQTDTSYTFTRKPQRAVIAASADLGYTYGYYSIQPHGIDTTMFGTYISIWKKQIDNTWKIVMDSENAGIGVEENNEVE